MIAYYDLKKINISVVPCIALKQEVLVLQVNASPQEEEKEKKGVETEQLDNEVKDSHKKALCREAKSKTRKNSEGKEEFTNFLQHINREQQLLVASLQRQWHLCNGSQVCSLLLCKCAGVTIVRILCENFCVHVCQYK